MVLVNVKRPRERSTMSIAALALLPLVVSVLAQDADPSEVDRPVPVERIHVMAGDRVELACQVVAGLISAAHHDDDHRQQRGVVVGGGGGGPGPVAFESRSRSAAGRHQQQQQQAASAASAAPAYYSLAGFAGSARASGSLRSRHDAQQLAKQRTRRYHPHRRQHPTDDYPAASEGVASGGYSHELDEMDGGYLVLWFIDPERKPFYSLDMRRSRTGRHWWDEQRFGQRVRFLVPQQPAPSSSSAKQQPTARLIIANVSRHDAGDYRCRVDYNNAPSRNFKYHLVVVEPPTSVVITDGAMHQLSIVAGPLEEGSDLILTCKAFGGHPQPWVTWWQGGQLRDNTTDARSAEFVSNLLVVPRIARRNLHDAFTCQVTSSPHLPPIMKTVTLELNLRPLFVEMTLSGPPASGHHSSSTATTTTATSKPFVAGQSVEIKCRTGGSRPAPTVTWWKGNKQIPPHLSTTIHSDDGNATESRLTLTPISEDDASYLTCRVKNSMLSGAVLEDSIKLDVQYPPEVRIALGSNINGDDIKEGDDLYIECHIKSNPSFHKLQWTHNGVALAHNVSAGVVLSNVSLVLRSVTHTRAGLYACSAANSRGESTSQPPLRLRIKYAPRCRSVSAAGTISGVSKQETASLDCQVDADPATEVHFWWTFLGTPVKSNATSLVNVNDAVLLPRSLFTSRGSTSVLQYSPKSELDFGVVACWASNSVGNQREPCLFHVVPAGKPAAPANCAIQNQTADSVRVDCQEAFDGGLQQVFGLELVDRDTRTVRYAFNNTKPVFTVYGLEPETAFLLNIYALNAKGRSQPITLETTTLRAAQKQTGHVLYFQMTPLLGVLIGAAATLLSIVAAVAVVVHRRNNRKRHPGQGDNSDHPSGNQTGSSANASNQQPLHGQQTVANTHITGNGNPPANGGPAPDGQHRHAANKELDNNGYLVQHFAKLNSTSDQHVHKDPDIILRDMDFQMKHTLPGSMVMNGSLHAKASTLRPGVSNKIDADGSDAESLLFRRELSSRATLHPRHLQQSSQSLSNRSSPSWHTSTPSTSSDRWSGPSHQSPSPGLFANSAALTQHEQHKIAADLLANCRLPESSL